MFITEKPSAAKKIAKALDDERTPREIKKGKVSYFECKRGNYTLIVVYALGHLYELKQIEKGWTYPRFENEWVPKYEVDKKAANIKPVISLISRLSKDIDSYVIATDYDIEGSLIGYLTLQYACRGNSKDAKRMRFSSLTEIDLEHAFQNMTSLDFPMIESGQVRHEVDWLYGINLTRALTLSIKRAAGWFKVVSTGRVQGPTLSFAAEKEREINLFIPLPFWIISLLGEGKGVQFELEYKVRQVRTLDAAKRIIDALSGQVGFVRTINNRTVEQKAHPPFNLSSLQSEAFRQFGYKPSRTLDIAQSLYLDALISYPRTSSEQLPETLDIEAILTGLSNMKEYSAMSKKILKRQLKPVQGEKTDPAHPAIHPTGEQPTKRLSPSEKNLYDLVVKRFLALFGDPLVKDHLRVDIECGEHVLYLRGLQILKPGWTEYYEPYFKTNEKSLPNIQEGDVIKIVAAKYEERYTQPPARFNPSSLLKILERENLGTKSTRARIVDSVKSRGYTIGERFELSTLGSALYETLRQHVPIMLSSEMTRDLEQAMDAIQNGEAKREDVLEQTKTNLLEILEKFREQEEEIGQDLVNGLQQYWKYAEEIGPCPKCDDGILRIIQSPKTGKRFVGCSNYKEGRCDQTFPLPQKGSITPLENNCPYCNHRMIRVISGRRSWKTCINWTQCPGRQNELQALEQRREKQASKMEEDKTDG